MGLFSLNLARLFDLYSYPPFEAFAAIFVGGTAIVAGHDVQREPRAAKQAIGYLAQTPLLYEKLTGREFLRFGGALWPW